MVYICNDCENENPCQIENDAGNAEPAYCPYDGTECNWHEK